RHVDHASRSARRPDAGALLVLCVSRCYGAAPARGVASQVWRSSPLVLAPNFSPTGFKRNRRLPLGLNWFVAPYLACSLRVRTSCPLFRSQSLISPEGGGLISPGAGGARPSLAETLAAREASRCPSGLNAMATGGRAWPIRW